MVNRPIISYSQIIIQIIPVHKPDNGSYYWSEQTQLTNKVISGMEAGQLYNHMTSIAIISVSRHWSAKQWTRVCPLQQ